MSNILLRENGIVLTCGMLLFVTALVVGEYYLSNHRAFDSVLTVSIVSEMDSEFDEGDDIESLSIVQQKVAEDIVYQLTVMKELHETLISQYADEPSATWLAVAERLVEENLNDDAMLILQRLEKLGDNFVDVKFHLAKLYSSKNDWKNSITKYRDILTMQPNHQASQINLGLILAKDNQHALAVNEFAKAVEIASGERKAKAQAAAGDSFMELQNFFAAESMYEESIRYRPGHAPTWRKLAKAKLENGEPWTEVSATLNQAIALHPDYLLGRLDQIQLMWLMQDTTAAKSAMEALYSMAPDFVTGRWQMAHFYLAEQKPRSALKHIKWLQRQAMSSGEQLLLSVVEAAALGEWSRVITLLDDMAREGTLAEADRVIGNRWLSYYFAWALMKKGVVEEQRIASLVDYVANDPWLNSQSDLLLAELAMARGANSEANDYLIALLEKNPKSASLNYKFGRMLLEQAEPERAIEPLRRAVELLPAATQYQLSLALAYSRAEQLSEAHKIYNTLIANHPDHKIARFNFAILLKKLGKTDDAIAQYRKVLELDTSYSNAQYNLAQLLRAEGESMEAAALLLDILEKNPVHYIARKNLIDTYLQQRDYINALTEVKRLLALQPGDESVLIQKFEILRDMGELQAAAEVVFLLPESAFDELLVTKLYNLGVQVLDAGNLALAELCNKQVLKIDNQRDKALVNLSAVYNRSERFHETVALLEGSPLLGHNEKLPTNLAEAWFELGEYQKVVELLTPLQQLAPLTSEASQLFVASVEKTQLVH